MIFSSQYKHLQQVEGDARKLFDEIDKKPRVLSLDNLSTFCGQLGYACRLVAQEKEILFFAVLQWVVISLSYLLWTQILDWIPDSLWEEVRKSNEREDNGAFIGINLVLLVWSFLVVMVASYPLSLLNAAMTASHYLRHSRQTSTIAKCLNLAFKNLGRLWVFTTIDAWITVGAILDRLPKKRGNRTALDELLYYAWKIGTIGVLPALAARKTYIDAAKDSILILRKEPLRVIGVRMGYSLVCWIVGILGYVGSIYYFIMFGIHTFGGENGIFRFYLLMAVPIIIAVGAVSVLVRPFFLIIISKIYTDIVPIDTEVTNVTQNHGFDWLALFFSTLLSALLALYFFGDQLGIRGWIEALATKDIQIYLNQN